jgi:hypothetical protein
MALTGVARLKVSKCLLHSEGGRDVAKREDVKANAVGAVV